MAGAIQCFAGYFSTWAAVTGLIPRPPVAAMCLFVFVAAHAESFFNTADVVTSVRNFRHFSGTAAGIMKVIKLQLISTNCFISRHGKQRLAESPSIKPKYNHRV